jgi:hypothetical protein
MSNLEGSAPERALFNLAPPPENFFGKILFALRLYMFEAHFCEIIG